MNSSSFTDSKHAILRDWFLYHMRVCEDVYVPFNYLDCPLSLYLEETGYGVRCKEKDTKNILFYKLTELGQQIRMFYKL
jgi:hypothetical protein